ncbi:ribosome-associated translation inhibitor RaiA [bacterium NHP-B]|nr:ribosome-associated translation inhibitor RaiA [bacterium NHP-B]
MMTHAITGKNIDLGPTFHQYIETELIKLKEKYHLKDIDAHVIFEKAPHHKFHMHIIFPINKTHILKAHSEHSEAYQSAHDAFTQMGRNIQRYKRRLHDHHKHHDNHKFPRKDQTLSA